MNNEPIEGAIPLYTHPAQELNDGGEPVKNATYWKRQYNEMSALNDRLKSSLYHANEQIKYLEFHPAKPIDKPDECLNGCPENQVCDYCAGIKTLTYKELNMWVSENMDKYYFKVGGGDLRFNAHMFAEALLKKLLIIEKLKYGLIVNY